MTDPQAILGTANWIPHRFDPESQSLQFCRLDRECLSQPAFLADAANEAGVESASVPLAQVASSQVNTAPVHFLFHTAFCRSTLLARALEQPGLCAGLSEPGVIASLVNAGQAGQQALPHVVRLLSRPWGEGEAVFVKPTNHANVLVPALMEAAPAARAVLITNPLPSFLAAVTRKGMMGRRWGRQLYLEVMGYAGMDLGMDAREQFALTDLQAAGLAWFLNQRFLDALSRKYGDRVRILDGDRFGAEPAKTLEAVGALCSVAISADKASAIASGPVFGADAKTGEDYAAKSARDSAATKSAVVEDEVGKVGEWIGMIAKQSGLEVPIKQTLF